MELTEHLPSLPKVALDELESESRPGPGFLTLVRRKLQVEGQSRTFVYDEVDRTAIDAVVLAAHFTRAGDARPWVVLRSALRPPVALRDLSRSPLHDERPGQQLWELPAGLVERSEASAAGVRQAAARELSEETGFHVDEQALRELGASAFPCPGVLAERQFFFHVRVELDSRKEPSLDGSVLESLGQLVAVPLGTALDAARAGELADAKTELGLRRLQEVLG